MQSDDASFKKKKKNPSPAALVPMTTGRRVIDAESSPDCGVSLRRDSDRDSNDSDEPDDDLCKYTFAAGDEMRHPAAGRSRQKPNAGGRRMQRQATRATPVHDGGKRSQHLRAAQQYVAWFRVHRISNITRIGATGVYYQISRLARACDFVNEAENKTLPKCVNREEDSTPDQQRILLCIFSHLTRSDSV
jgi:hypothetical protein